MIQKRPININPFSIRLPIMALVSITHRLSGILVFLLIPFLLSSLHLSLVSPEGLTQVKEWWSTPICKLVIWLFISGIIFHLLAGLRHLLMDIHCGGSYRAGKLGAYIVTVLSLLGSLGTAVWLWR